MDMDETLDSVIKKFPELKEFSFDSKHGKWCSFVLEFSAAEKKLLFVEFAEQAASLCMLQSTPGITNCFPQELQDKSMVLNVTGCNFAAAWAMEAMVDVNRLYTNDVDAVLKTYGVEAARTMIQQELRQVFDAYGIEVDWRHLGLIADFMTFEGGWRPFNRIGMDKNVSPFQKMSYETTTTFLMQAALSGDMDTLSSPSSRIVVGNPVASGTGSFELVHQL